MDRIKEYLATFTKNLAFITIDKPMTQAKKDIGFLKDVPIPVSLPSITKDIKQNSIEKLPFEAIVKGMIIILGVDKDFKYNDKYKQFLFLTNKKIVDYIIFQGLKLANEEKYYDAAVYFRAVFVLDDANLNALYNYGRCCKDIFDLSKNIEEKKSFKDEAIETFEKIIEKFPDFSLSYYYLGFFYLNQKMFKKTQIIWKKYLELCDDKDKKDEIELRLKQLNDHVIYEEGYTFILNGKYEKGLALLLPLEENHSKWWNLLFFIGLAYRNLGDYERAVDYYKKVMVIKPSQVDTMNELGLCYTSIGDYKNAEKFFKKAILINENDYEILSNLAVVYMNTGRYDDAENCLNKASCLCPDDEIINKWLEKLREIKHNNQLN